MGKPMSTVYVPDEYGRLVPTQVPTYVGFIGLYAGPEPPEGYLYCDGSAIGRETYSELYEAIGTLYGVGDGAETFNFPDARGVFFRGDGGEAAAMGTQQGDAIRNIEGQLGVRPLRNDNTYLVEAASAFANSSSPGAFYVASALREESTPSTFLVSHYDSSIGTYINYASFHASRVVPTAAENRPINYAVNICIVFE